MISERQFAGGFGSFWSELFPLLTPACVTIFNESHGQDFDDGRPVEVVLPRVALDALPMDLLAESAFLIAAAAHRSGTTAANAAADAEVLEACWREAVRRIGVHREVRNPDAPTPGSDASLFLSVLARRYDLLVNQSGGAGEVEFAPLVPGCGFLSSSAADFAAGATLFEIKAVARNFSSRDIKQLIVYLAVDHCTGARRWNRAALYNPRRNRIARFDPESLIKYISGGSTAGEVYREIESFLGDRELVMDGRF